MAGQGGNGEAERLKDAFWDSLQELRVPLDPAWSSRQTSPNEERSIEVLCRTSRAMYGDGNDVGVSPLMMEMLRGYMRSCGHQEARITELYQMATLNLATQRRMWVCRQRHPRRRSDGPLHRP